MDEVEEKWYIALLCVTGSSWEGTREERYEVRSTRSYRCGNPDNVGMLYDTREEAEEACRKANGG